MKEFDPGEMPSIASLTDQVRALPVGMPVSSIYFLGDTAVFVGAEEHAAMVNRAGEVSKVTIHGGAVLCAASDGKRTVTGGDDGKVVALDAKGEVTVLATDAKRRWIDNVALHGWQGPRHLGRRHRDHLAVRQQGRSDGQGARDAGAAAGARLHGRLSSEAGHHGRGL